MMSKTHSRIAPARERGRVIRLDYARALAHLPGLVARAAKGAHTLFARLWATLCSIVPQARAQAAFGHPAAIPAGSAFALLHLRPKRVCHACCRLNKAPPAP